MTKRFTIQQMHSRQPKEHRRQRKEYQKRQQKRQRYAETWRTLYEAET